MAGVKGRLVPLCEVLGGADECDRTAECGDDEAPLRLAHHQPEREDKQTDCRYRESNGDDR